VHARHLYIHVPFCARRCVYCDFSIAVRPVVPVDEYLTALEREFAARHRDTQLRLDTAYLGGGTPSKLGADGLARLMDLLRRFATIEHDAEVTLEANPEDVTRESARSWRQAGINRVSLGVQSFSNDVLGWMHRTHDAGAAKVAIETIRDQGIPNVSIDLIFAIPSVIPRSWRDDLETALSLSIPHISVYGLTVEAKTPLGRRVARSAMVEAGEDAFETEFLGAHDALSANGYEHYEVSNYGRAGKQSRHNWSYWRRAPYVGLGPSAHEYDGSSRRWNVTAYAEWVGTLARAENPTAGEEALDSSQTIAEEVYLGLRTTDGIMIGPAERDHVRRWLDAGWGTIDAADRLRLTVLGWLRLDALANDLTMLRSRS
jgi:oxygen-independent coproporphyrinogen-3 oxidase